MWGRDGAGQQLKTQGVNLVAPREKEEVSSREKEARFRDSKQLSQ